MTDADAYTRPSQLTETMRRGLYSAIDPNKPELTAAGKGVIITGAGGGIGYDIAAAWATAGASGIVLAGRNIDMLKSAAENVKSIDKDIPTLIQKTDVASEADVKELYGKVNEKFGRADVVVNNAATGGYGKVGDIEPGIWWRDHEVNVKGTFLMTHYFIKQFGAKGTFVNIISFGAFFVISGNSSYATSKLATAKFGEFLDAEYPELRVFSVNPGIVEKNEGRGMLVDAFKPFAKDTGISTGGLSLYLSTPKADYLRGGTISVNWDVNEMEEHKSEIVDKKLLKIAFLNATLSSDGHPWET
ncbi:hypothetical protein MMC29_003991 [Sticta canariensis]|nr:hypothetical protein [Sticta canariensis]